MKKILVTGAKGQLGTELRRLTRGRVSFIFTDIAAEEGIEALDICNEKGVREFVEKHDIGTIVNCAAFTDVEGAEDRKELCMKINVDGPSALAKAAKEAGAALVQISTDFVFDGLRKRGGYTEKDKTNPLSVYGLSKDISEQELRKIGSRGVIIRTAWLYSPYGKNFCKTMLRLGSTRDEISVVADQIGSPTYAADLAKAILKIIPQIGDHKMEIYHFSNEGKCSWQEFASQIMLAAGLKCKVSPIASADYPQKAQRPAYSYLSKEKIKRDFGVEVPEWKESLEACLRRKFTK